MRRRTFLAMIPTSLLAAPLAAEAQQAGKTYRIGFLRYFACSDEIGLKDLRQRLRDLGYVEGRNLIIECRASPGKWDQLPDLATELMGLGVDILVTEGTPPSLAAKQVTRTVPIVLVYVGDPVENGLVSSLARPGGNITGVSLSAVDIVRKDIELLKQIAPGISRVTVWMDSTNPGQALPFSAMAEAARVLRVQLQRVDIRTAAELDGAFATTLKHRAEAVVVYPLHTTPRELQRIEEFVVKNRLPTATIYSAYVKAGLLLFYGPNIPDVYHRAATYVDRVLRGGRPADLPIEQPTKFDLVINLKTAKALGLTIPPSLLARADQVIE